MKDASRNGLEHTRERFTWYLLAARLAAGRRVLDVGSPEGGGAFLLAREASHVLCLEALRDESQRASQRYRRKNLEFFPGGLEDLLPQGEGSYDVATCFEVVERLDTEQRHETLERMEKLLSPSGVLLVSAARSFGFLEFRDLLEAHFGAAIWYAHGPLSGSSLRMHSRQGESAAGPTWAVEPLRLVESGLVPDCGPVIEKAGSFLVVCARDRDVLRALGLPRNLVLFDPDAGEAGRKTVWQRAPVLSDRGLSERDPSQNLSFCVCCGGTNMRQDSVLWEDLIEAWQLSAPEAAYINRQQGLCCASCDSNLRSMTLAKAIMSSFGFSGLLVDFVRAMLGKGLRVLEINPAGQLTQFLKLIPGHQLVEYPWVDMMDLPFQEASFDLAVHSDTLEHVEDPVRGLAECRRVLAPGAFCAFTVPMIVDRLTRSRAGLRPSYHGSARDKENYLVHTEYGADAWKHCLLAGFRECRISSIIYPESQAFVAVR